MSDEKHTAKKRSSSASTARNGCPTIDLQERTLRVTNIDSKVTKELLRELFNQVGPVVNVVLKPDFAFIEFEDSDSVAYAIAMMDGVKLFDSELNLQPKLQKPEYFRYLNTLREYEMTIACNPDEWLRRFGLFVKHPSPYLCTAARRYPPPPPPVPLPQPIPPQVQMYNRLPYSEYRNSYEPHHRHSYEDAPRHFHPESFYNHNHYARNDHYYQHISANERYSGERYPNERYYGDRYSRHRNDPYSPYDRFNSHDRRDRYGNRRSN